jgi:hypothetical protein
MKRFAILSSLCAALFLAAPTTGWSGDHGHHGGGHYHGGYCGPSYYHGFRPYFGISTYPIFYGGYYPYYPAYSYYDGPSVGVSISSSPGYYRGIQRSESSDDDLTVDVQRALSKRGHYRGPIDGDAGPQTRAAIRDYQYKNRLEVTGRIDRALLRSLGLA